MIPLSHAEFHITNHCNINCERCTRFNNYNFRGHYDWLEHADTYRRWAQHVNFETLGILGGEPLMNPNIIDWIKAIRSWWPNVTLSIGTNGTLLTKIKNLYETVRDNRVKINISVHNYDWIPSIIENLKDFYPGDYGITELDDKIFFTKIAKDTHGVTVIIKKYNSMTVAPIYIDQTGRAKLHESDIKKAHDTCGMKSCHQFVNGKLYKCSVPPMLNEFIKQFPLKVSEFDRSIIERPGGLTVDEFISDAVAGIQYLQGSIAHCKFCPEKYEYIDIAPSIGKTVFPMRQI